MPQFTIKVKGARVTSWEYRDALKGAVRHRGEVLSNGDITLTFVATNAELGIKKPVLYSYQYGPGGYEQQPQPSEWDAYTDEEFAALVVPIVSQTWTPVGQDWNRRYYKLKTIEAFNRSSGKVSTRCLLQDDGVTPSSIEHYVEYNYYGSGGQQYYKQRVEYYNSKGYPTRFEYYDQNGNVQNSQDVDPRVSQNQGPAGLDPSILAEIGDGRTRTYRLRGNPFTETAPAEGYKLTPMFVP